MGVRDSEEREEKERRKERQDEVGKEVLIRGVGNY